MRSNLFIIAQSGFKYVIGAALLCLFFVVIDFDFLALLAFVALLIILFVFRNPERELVSFEDEAILSPVDGTIRAIEELDDEEYGYRVEIVSSYTDVSLLRAPINASVADARYEKGARLSKNSQISSNLNENLTVVFLDNSENKIKITHTLTQSFAPLFVDIHESQRVLKSSRYGVMLCGVSSVYLPKNVRINVNISNEVKASETLLGFFS